MKKAVGYFRVSTDKVEQRESIKNQEELFLNYIKDNGYALHKFYVDQGITGTGRKKRPAFDQMVADMGKGDFEVIIVKELSRLARNVELATWTKRMAIEQDIRIVSIDGQVDTFDEKKNEDFALYAWLYQKESQQISSRIKSVYKTKQKSGLFLGSVPPYGYSINDKKLVKRNDYTEEVVKEIFRLFLAGWGQEKIARYLDKQGYPTPAQLVNKSNAGRYWHGTTVKKILTNYHYMGHLVQHRETTKSITSTKRKFVDKEDLIWINNTHEAIIDETTFNLVQSKIKEKTKGGKGKTVRYNEQRHLFTNYLFCSDCGMPFWWREHTHGYLCGARLKRGRSACDNDIIREQQLINLIKRDIKSFLNKEINIDVESKLDKDQDKNEKKFISLRNKIQNLSQKNKKYIDLLVDDIITKEEYTAYVEQNNLEIENLQKQINELSPEHKKERLDIRSIKSQLEKVLKLETLDRELLNLLVNRIEVSKNGELKVFYTFAPPKSYNHKKQKAII